MTFRDIALRDIAFWDLADEERAELQEQILEVAWTFARGAAGFAGPNPYDRVREKVRSLRVVETGGLAPQDRRRVHLGWLRVLGIMEAELTLAAEFQACLAAGEGANFRELGDA